MIITKHRHVNVKLRKKTSTSFPEQHCMHKTTSRAENVQPIFAINSTIYRGTKQFRSFVNVTARVRVSDG